ncbi:MAG: hypothetical protein JSW07_13900 [bacterium]|nr:MAG: hypothetical protein JSW07_13900 [bacterium]
MDFGFLKFLIKAGCLVIPFLWQNMLYAGTISIIIWIAIALLKIRSPRWHYALWCLVLIRLALPQPTSLILLAAEIY